MPVPEGRPPPDTTNIRTEARDSTLVVTIHRPDVRNAVDRSTAAALADAFRSFEADEALRVAVLTGAGGHFCAGADLKAMLEGPDRANRVEPDGDGPMGPTRMLLRKPVVAAVEGYAVAGGLELALWCDLRVAAETAVFGVFSRRFGVPLIDGGNVRLPRIVGLGRALDMILTARAVDAAEALSIGLVNRVCAPGAALETALDLATTIASWPQGPLRGDRLAAIEGSSLPLAEAMENEFSRGVESLSAGETLPNVGRFAAGEGRHGAGAPHS
ncbi:MAG TPA: crotonase/enoyl-CoA hydratase family protein [Actinomycetota bacterium]|nr:crotonase/enoyl-CoA hydratase family protein [Actinomycetota bacterium]